MKGGGKWCPQCKCQSVHIDNDHDLGPMAKCTNCPFQQTETTFIMIRELVKLELNYEFKPFPRPT